MKAHSDFLDDSNLSKFQENFREIGCRCRIESISAWRQNTLPNDLWQQLATAELFSILTNQSLGHRQGIRWLARALEGLAYGLLHQGITVSLISHIGLCLSTIDRYAQPSVKDKYLHRLTNGQEIAVFAATEPQVGLNTFHAKSELIAKDDEHYILSGEKWHIHNAPLASVIITFAHFQENNDLVAVLVDANKAGVEILSPPTANELRGSPVSSVIFNQVIIPKTHILGQGIAARRILKDAVMIEKILSPFSVIGITEHLIDKALNHAKSCQLLGKPLGNHQHFQQRITEMKIGLETMRALANSTLQKYCAEENISLEAAMTKMYIDRVSADVYINAMKIYMSYGIPAEMGFTEALLDGMTTTITGETEESHRSIMYNQMLRQHHPKELKSEKPPHSHQSFIKDSKD
jgi:isovaleryl-CoA dehydrogenase